MKNRSILLTSLAIVAALLLTSCGAVNSSPEAEMVEPVQAPGLIAEGKFEPRPAVELAFGSSGVVSQVFINAGQTVSKGEPIARLSVCGPMEADLAAAQADLVSVQQNLKDLELYAGVESANALQALIDAQEAFDEAQNDWDDFDFDAYQDDLGEEQEDVQQAQDDLDEAIAELEEYLDLEEDNPTRERYQDAVDDAESDLHLQQQDLNEVENDYRQAQHDYDLAAGQLTAAQAEYDLKKEGADADQRALLQARITALESAIAGLQEHITACQVIAPFDGSILFNDLQPGEFVQAGDPRIKIADTSVWIVKTDDVSEYDVISLQIGQSVKVTADAIPGVTMDGTVVDIDQTATLDHGDVTYTMTIVVENIPPELRWGMTAAIRFLPAD